MIELEGRGRFHRASIFGNEQEREEGDVSQTGSKRIPRAQESRSMNRRSPEATESSSSFFLFASFGCTFVGEQEVAVDLGVAGGAPVPLIQELLHLPVAGHLGRASAGGSALLLRLLELLEQVPPLVCAHCGGPIEAPVLHLGRDLLPQPLVGLGGVEKPVHLSPEGDEAAGLLQGPGLRPLLGGPDLVVLAAALPGNHHHRRRRRRQLAVPDQLHHEIPPLLLVAVDWRRRRRRWQRQRFLRWAHGLHPLGEWRWQAERISMGKARRRRGGGPSSRRRRRAGETREGDAAAREQQRRSK